MHENYLDFGPTLAREKAIERHEIAVSKEMRTNGLVRPESGRHAVSGCCCETIVVFRDSVTHALMED